MAKPKDVDRAVDAARKAFDEGPWPRMSGRERAGILFKLADLLEENAEELALLETLDNGKTYSQSSTVDIPETIYHFRYFAGFADKIEGATIPVGSAGVTGKGFTAYTLREPIGVVGQILPWNFPALMAAWKLAPALAVGCTVVLKVSQHTPMTGLRIAELALEAGLPPGVLNVLTGKGSDIGDAICNHPGIDKVAFTGSTKIGKIIGGTATGNLKPVTLELGGNSPVIVTDTADLEAAALGAHEALFFNAGQACECGARVFVDERVYDEFCARSIELAKGRKTGDPFDPDVKHGPMISEQQMDKVLELIESGKKQGAKLENAEELALLETLDNGKTYSQSSTVDIPETIYHFRYFAGFADKIEGATIPVGSAGVTGKGFTAYTLREPIGVVGQILPWNFPALMAAWKLAPALAVGCTVVLKVSQHTPMTGLRIAELALEAGLPPGVLNVLTGKGSDIGDAICNHPGIDKVAFTGSTKIGKIIGGTATGNLKPVTLELGGNSPVIVTDTADLEAAALGAHEALFFNAGQACECGARVFVDERVYDEFCARSIELAKGRKTGDPFDPDVKHGPMISEQQMDKVLELIESGKKQGAKLVAGGERLGEEGYFLQPTVFVDVQDDMDIARDEIFGPVQIIFKYKTLEEGLRRANDTNYGLASAVWTKDIETMQLASRTLKAGTVWVNTHHVLDAAVPFGGYKESGLGREHGKEVLEHYTQTKAVYIPLPKNNPWQIM
ncbi:Aldehyde dehydrogenase X, mitochondrial [Auxenochlorella protothecoides]|uniref:Aldehyde dehydrogenase X, mitochondrial n=2 Tax=Auxenochlorella protothecoides TaxID=3075 RepID=A0A087SD32_AUXPR|nr:Aldehyde dehydrogenase X, mitochondrial [Auxenochlorella protothecoides]KFM23636.1 Aldehyde dehydrogenase X, mitochondrial [Auxenochlorella protothecoides]